VKTVNSISIKSKIKLIERRVFFGWQSTSIAGLSMVIVYTISNNNIEQAQTESFVSQTSGVEPAYRSKVKTVFSKHNSKSANDRVALTLTWVGKWGTNLILNAFHLKVINSGQLESK
jgi:hypothetical protein